MKGARKGWAAYIHKNMPSSTGSIESINKQIKDNVT